MEVERIKPAMIESRANTALRLAAALAAAGVVVSTFLVWFGVKVSKPSDGAGLIVVLPKAPPVTAWEASVLWTLAIVGLSTLIVLAAILPRRGTPTRVVNRGLPLVLLGAVQSAAILLFARYGAPRPFPRQAEVIDGHNVTAEFGLLVAGQVALLLALAVAVAGAVLILRERKVSAPSLDEADRNAV